MRQSKTHISLISKTPNTSLEESTFYVVTFWATLVSLLYGITGFFVPFYPIIIYTSFLSMFLYGGMYYLSRFHALFNFMLLPFLLTVLVSVAFAFIAVGGTYSDVPILFILISIMAIIITPKKMRWYYLSLVFFTFGILLLIQILFPEVIMTQPSVQGLRYAIINTTSITMLAIWGLLINFKRRYEYNEQLIKDKNSQLAKATKAKSKFLANMSHEIRTPMNGVLGMANLLKATSLNSDQKEYTTILEQSGERLMNVLNEILDFSKIEANEIRLEQVPFSLYACVDECLNLCRKKMENSSVDLHYKCAENIPNWIIGDSKRLQQIILHLLENAFKFTNEGSVTLQIHLKSASDQKLELLFTVTDTGIGIEQQYQQQLFKEFSQVDSSSTRRYGGTGLGLVIVKELAKLMEGEVGFESQPGKGSAFFFTILTKASKAPASIIEHQVIQKEKNNPKLSPLQVLVVEDNPINQKLMERMFSKLNLPVDLAVNGIEAVKMCQATAYNLVLMDVQMPKMDGIEATQLIKKQNLPPIIIGLTANDSIEDRQNCLSAGMNDFLTKPISFETLQKVLEKWVS